jgi:hypothetical protein
MTAMNPIRCMQADALEPLTLCSDIEIEFERGYVLSKMQI